METKKCGTCKKILPISAFECHKDCRKCYAKDYYKRNKKTILNRSRNYRATASLKKKQNGTYHWTNSLEDETAKFQFFLDQNNIKIDYDG